MLELLAGATLRSLCLAAAVGTGLRLRRTHNPHVSLAAWTLVLLASLSMPVAMRLTYVALPHSVIRVAQLPPASFAEIDATLVTSGIESSVAAVLPANRPSWRGIASLLYLTVFGVLMLRLLLGIALSWRIARAATPIREDWADGFDVRATRRIEVPATFGSVILLPANHGAWTSARRLAVLAHEGAHVARRDFAIQLAACVHRTIFWFNPFSWWLRHRLSDLAEAASDDAAIAVLNDRFGYAEILLELSGRVSRLPGAVSMARRGAVAWRIERILSETPPHMSMSRRGRMMLAAGIVPLAVVLSFLIVLPAPAPRPPAAVEAAAVGVKQPIPSAPPAIVAEEMARPAASVEAKAAPIVPDVPPLVAASRTEVVAMAPAPAVKLLSSPRSAETAPDASRPAPRSAVRNTPATEASVKVQRVIRTASKDRSPRPAPVGTEGATTRSAPGEDQTTGDDSRALLFKRLVNETCMGTYVGGRGGTPMPYYYYPVQARFYRGPGDSPWVSFAFAKQRPADMAADMPVTVSDGKIEFTGTQGKTYTLSRSESVLLPSRYQRLIGATEQSSGGIIDVACGKLEPSRLRTAAR